MSYHLYFIVPYFVQPVRYYTGKKGKGKVIPLQARCGPEGR